MTIETQTPRVVIIGNGTRGPYSLVDSSGQAIRFVSTSHLRLTRYTTASDTNSSGTVLVLNTDYTVGGTEDARTFTLASGQAVLTSNQRIVAERVQSYTQDLDLTTGGAFNAAAVEARLNKIVEFQQELKTRLDRVPVLQFADATANVAFPTVPSSLSLLARSSTGALVHATAADFGAGTPVDAAWLAILGVTPGDEWAELLEVDAEVFHVEAYADAAALAGNWTTAIQAASAALEANGGGILRGLRGKTYAIYPDATNTSPLGDFDNCKGVYLDFPGCTFTIARAFTNSQFLFPWVFEECDGFGWSDHTVTCAQVDTPDLSYQRGINWITVVERNSQVRGGFVKQTGGKACVDFVRNSTTVTNQTSLVEIAGGETVGVGYPIQLRNTGRLVKAGKWKTTDATRPTICYGFVGLEMEIERVSTGQAGETTIIFLANGTGSGLTLNDPVTRGLKLKYRSTSGLLNAAHVVIEARGTSALTLSDVDIEYDIDMGSAGLSQQFFVALKTTDSVTFDSSTRGHTLENFRLHGSVRNVPATRVADFFKTSLGDWAGENIRGFSIRDLNVTGSASASYEIDYDGFVDGPFFENFVFPGTVTRTGTIPDTFIELGVKDADGVRPMRFGNPRLAARSAGLPYPLAAITTAQTGVTGSTSETNLHTAISVPAAALGANGELRLSGSLTMTNNANAKTLRVKYGGTTFATAALASGAGYRFEAVIKNRNSASAQIGGLAGSGILTSTTGTVNTANALDVQLTMELADGADTVTLQDLSVDLVYRA